MATDWHCTYKSTEITKSLRSACCFVLDLIVYLRGAAVNECLDAIPASKAVVQ